MPLIWEADLTHLVQSRRKKLFMLVRLLHYSSDHRGYSETPCCCSCCCSPPSGLKEGSYSTRGEQSMLPLLDLRLTI